MRALAIHLPAFRLERCGFHADEVAGLLAEHKSAARLVALTPAAQAEGLRLEMTAAEARATVPDVLLHELDADGERQDLHEMLTRFTALSDQCGLFPHLPAPPSDPCRPVTVVVGAHTAPVFGGEKALVTEARHLAEGLGHSCQIVLADHKAVAAALAQHGDDEGVFAPGTAAVALSHLPIQALRWPTESPKRRRVEALFAALQAVGITRVGELARLDVASVAGRFGEEGVQAHRLARGDCPAPNADSSEPEPLPQASVRFPDPVSTLQPVHFVLRGLLAQLSQALAARDLAAMRLLVRLGLERGAPRSVWVRAGRPTRNPARLESLVRNRLEGVKLTAPIAELRIQVDECVVDTGWQPGLTDRAEASEPLPELVARLADALGEDAIFRPELVERWRPESAWRSCSAVTSTEKNQIGLFRPRKKGDVDPVVVQERWERDIARNRPSLLLDPPMPIRVSQGSALLDDRWLPVQPLEGIERLQGEWWAATAFDRDYLRARLGDGTAWLYRESGQWYLHGWFD